jgi:predicted Zn-dependent peptidase
MTQSLSPLHTLAFRTTTLPNGLRVVVVPQPQLHRAHVALYVRIGSRFETKETNGISHFLEHMLYRGTDRLPSAHAVNLAFEEHGGYLYASTQTDYGIFSLTLPPESVERAATLFGEVLSKPAFLDIGIERGIVCEEILEDLDDEGRQVDPDNLSRALIYPSHPLGFTITGSETQVQSFDEKMLRAHHARHYTAKNSVLVFSGAVDAERAMAVAERAFGVFPSGEPVVSAPPVHTQKKPRLEILENVSSQTELRICLRAVADNAKERPAVDMLMRVIDDGMSTRLYHRICDAQGLCYDVSAGFDGYEDDGIIDIAAGVQHSRAALVTSEVLAMLTELAAEGPTVEELAKAKRRHAWDMTSMLDSAEDVGAFFGGGFLFNRFETPSDRLNAIARVTNDEVRAAARMLADPSRLNVIAVGLLENGEDKRLADTVRGFRGATPG